MLMARGPCHSTPTAVRTCDLPARSYHIKALSIRGWLRREGECFTRRVSKGKTYRIKESFCAFLRAFNILKFI